MNTTNVGVVRVNITIPKGLLSELEKEVPKRGKSGFVAEAIEEKLTRKKRESALSELAKLPSTFINIKNGSKYIAKVRSQEDDERTVRLGT